MSAVPTPARSAPRAPTAGRFQRGRRDLRGERAARGRAGRRRNRPRSCRRRIRVAGRTVGLRQEHVAAHGRGSHRAERRHASWLRGPVRVRRACAATSASCSRIRPCSNGGRSSTTSCCRSKFRASRLRSGRGGRGNSSRWLASRALKRPIRATSPAACGSAPRSPGLCRPRRKSC